MEHNLSVIEQSETLDVLIIEDCAFDQEVLCGHISKAFPESNFTIFENLTDALHYLEGAGSDFIITDLDLPDSEGLDTLRAVIKAGSTAPILVYTGTEDSDWALQAMQMGAQDYLIKGRGDEFTFRRIMQYSIERKRIELRIYRNEQMLRTFIKHSPAGIAVFDRDAKVLMCSDRWKQEHELVDKQVLGETLETLLASAAEKWRYLFNRCVKGEVINCDEDMFEAEDGHIEYIRWEMMPWFDERNEIGGIILFTEFVTKEREMRVALQDAKDNLEMKVKERTRDLETAILATESAQAAKSEFFANITHELRTPLHAINNFSKFGMKKIDTAPKEKLFGYFEDINKSGHRLLNLVNDVLDLTKSQFGKDSFDFECCSVQEVIEAALREASGIAESKNITTVYDIGTGVSNAMFDTTRIHQVILNLLSNAIKFSPEGSTVRVLAKQSEHYDDLQSSQELVVITVRDEGVGIPDAELDTIFDEFAQSSKVKSGTFAAGTGLGLSICRHIVSSHNGTIWAENNEGGGASISFTLPVLAIVKESRDEQENFGN